ncbi:helix-turn-helix domain-containing protein [Bradyrhizobium sp. Bra78]|uniref:helix-turn-helix domain-containing protein n=1 Tax=Bradyrhizobium sp. Bra78 TaxID=2926010 RepID=UPI0021C76D2B|nr:helix-turn-helix domain-containing protein [Bradyrhizobium sp. Bra78]
MTVAKRRARRIAADEAHAWARNLRLNNPHAKLTLSMLTQYVDGDGYCFVSIPTLSDDTELSQQTVRNRLAWLEEIGAVARLPQWIDEYGRRNGDGRGKRTSDLIRLMIDVEPETIEAVAIGGGAEPVSREVSPMPQTGLNPPADPVSTTPALRQPYDSVEGLISEPELESSPKPPSRGFSDAHRFDGKEAEPVHFDPAWRAWPGHEVQRRDLALEAFRELSPDKQRHCRAAVPDYAAKLRELRQKRGMSFHLWIRAKCFDEFPGAMLEEDRPRPAERRFVVGEELLGLRVACMIAERRELPVRREPELGEGVWRTTPAQPDLVALAACGMPSAAWLVVDRGSEEFAAWRDRLQLWLGAEPRPEKIWLEDHDPAVHGLRWNHPGFKLRKSKEGLRVPAPWPPRRDGTWLAASQDDASQAGGDK